MMRDGPMRVPRPKLTVCSYGAERRTIDEDSYSEKAFSRPRKFDRGPRAAGGGAGVMGLCLRGFLYLLRVPEYSRGGVQLQHAVLDNRDNFGYVLVIL